MRVRGPGGSAIPVCVLIYAAQKKGIDPAVFLDDHDTMVTWKLQYEDLPTYNISGNEAIRLLPPDDLAPLPPVTYPQKPGRPAIARIKSGLEKKHKFRKSSPGGFDWRNVKLQDKRSAATTKAH